MSTEIKNKTFIVLSKAWYGDANLIGQEYCEEVNFGYRANDLSAKQAECAMRWYDLKDGKFPAPRLEIFDDSFSIFEETELFKELSEVTNYLSPDDFCAILEEHGFVNDTPLTNE